MTTQPLSQNQKAELKVKLEHLLKNNTITDITNNLAEVAGELAIENSDPDQQKSWRQVQGVLEGAATTLTRFGAATMTGATKAAGQGSSR